MSAAFDTALLEYRRLRAVELSMPSYLTMEEEAAHEHELVTACDATTEAFRSMFSIPVKDGERIAEKLHAVAEFYEISACGIDRGMLNALLKEIDAALRGSVA